MQTGVQERNSFPIQQMWFLRSEISAVMSSLQILCPITTWLAKGGDWAFSWKGWKLVSRCYCLSYKNFMSKPGVVVSQLHVTPGVWLHRPGNTRADSQWGQESPLEVFPCCLGSQLGIPDRMILIVQRLPVSGMRFSQCIPAHRAPSHQMCTPEKVIREQKRSPSSHVDVAKNQLQESKTFCLALPLF
jgi:hypothetical protein